MDNINQWIQITLSYRRPQPLEGNRQSIDTGQQSNMICRNEEDTAHRALSPTTSLFGSAFLCHDKHVPCGAMQPTTNSRCRKKKFCSGGPLGRGAPGTCPIGPMVNPALGKLVSCLKIPLLLCLQCVAANGAGYDHREKNGMCMQKKPHSEVCESSPRYS